ncbi:protein of unknown function [Candidatus Hydrogenisulfobacillus filiaventi]|uniref:Uncharacterized protein n=1 Tax=Candidatus Hydrogenisulfobacillus filiaventi TaxID=2707344 RepID=A0A6F8ZD99_9FIRM|nr:hypothetical protein [Bacillota bacterium]CAB1127613.1 protein of unknown function [Candidatus Hydrogenisulfobacillus filiaventi]
MARSDRIEVTITRCPIAGLSQAYPQLCLRTCGLFAQLAGQAGRPVEVGVQSTRVWDGQPCRIDLLPEAGPQPYRFRTGSAATPASPGRRGRRPGSPRPPAGFGTAGPDADLEAAGQAWGQALWFRDVYHQLWGRRAGLPGEAVSRPVTWGPPGD